MPRKHIEPVKLGEAIERFMREYKAQDRSESICRQKRRHLNMLVKHCPRKEHTLTRNLKTENFVDALLDAHQGGSEAENDWRRRQGLRPRPGNHGVSLDSFRTTYKQFAEWLKANGLVYPDFNPVYDIGRTARKAGTRPPERQFRRRFVPWWEWPRLIDATHHPRDRMLIATGLYLGRRASELAFMKWGHIDRERREVVLYNIKRRRMVLQGEPVYLNTVLAQEYDRYYRWYVARYGEPNPEHPFLPARMTGKALQQARQADGGSTVAFREKTTMQDWPLNISQPMRIETVRDIVHRTLIEFGWSESDLFGEGGHTLRRSCAVWAEEFGGLAAAQALMDHPDARMTQHYTKNAAGRRALKKLQESVEPPPEEPASAVPQQREITQTGDGGAVVIDFRTRRRIA